MPPAWPCPSNDVPLTRYALLRRAGRPGLTGRAEYSIAFAPVSRHPQAISPTPQSASKRESAGRTGGQRLVRFCQSAIPATDFLGPARRRIEFRKQSKLLDRDQAPAHRSTPVAAVESPPARSKRTREASPKRPQFPRGLQSFRERYSRSKFVARAASGRRPARHAPRIPGAFPQPASATGWQRCCTPEAAAPQQLQEESTRRLANPRSAGRAAIARATIPR